MPKADILIVEDDRIVAEDTKITLEKLGFGVSGIVPSGEASLERVEAEPPDLVLMDIELEGEMDGIEAAARIRDRFNIPIVYVTGYTEEDVLERAKVTQPFGYIIKPFEDRELNSAIEIALYKHKMETKLKESEKKYRSLYNNVPIGLFRSTPHGEFVSVNQYVVQMLGCKTASELMKIPAMEIYADPERRKDLFAHLHEKGTVKNFEIIVKHRNGKNIWISASIQAQFDHNGNIIFLDGVCENITQRKESEAAIQKASREWTLAMDAFDDIIYLLDNDRCVVQANSAFYKSMGITPDQAIGRHIVEIIHPQGEEKPCPVCLAQEEKRDFVMIMEADAPNNPAKRPIEITVKIVRNEDGTPSGILMNLHDLTTSRVAEQKLLDSEAQLNTLLNATTDIAFLAESDGAFLAVNSALAKSLSVEKEELINHSMYGFASREDAEKRKLIIQKGIEAKKPFQWKDDRIGRYFDNSVYPILDDKGDVKQIALFARDITKDVKAEETLRQYEHIISVTNDHMAFIDIGYTYIAVNDAYLIAHKKERSQITGHTVADLLGAEKFEQFIKEKVDRCLAGEELHYQEWFDFPGLDQRYMDVAYYPFTGSDGIISGVVVSSHDITERKQAQEKINASLKEKVVLLREIHHRVKNNMQVIISLLRMHGRRINDANLSKVFEDCRDRINAMSLIHESLYQSDNLAKIDFKVYLKKLCHNLSHAYGASGNGISLAVGECDVALDMDQGIAIGMVIAELISNAFKHAFPLGKGGNVSINLSELDAENVKLIIKDDGKGIPPKIDIMNSSSLGLRLAVSAVTLELGGSIEIDRGEGTQFTICFKYNCHGQTLF